ncbi:MAG: beta-phosphoglucomutase [Bacteroidota bacterium]|jgi:beta-phosphoglucomutase|nr:beta-phosphoglucomutase [Cytophagales bacterium]MCE2958773.1 beta-phosphoglucomutase [Flammeovirgaceae bacterium]MCZ8069073.1 beta-phosphoglucomutase [Cytophagales bacterium]
MIQAVIFDLDGVIVDTAHYHFVAWQRLAHELGITFTEHDNERLKGVSRMRSLEIILEIGGVLLSEEKKEELATKKNSWFVEYIEAIKPEEVFPGVPQMLQQLRAQNYKVALASSSKNAETVIRLLQIGHLFDAIVDGTMITHTKPDPEIFLLAAKKLNIAPAHCVVFEDAEAGVEAALAAGMKCVGVGSPAQLGKANFIVAKTAEFDLGKLRGL